MRGHRRRFAKESADKANQDFKEHGGQKSVGISASAIQLGNRGADEIGNLLIADDARIGGGIALHNAREIGGNRFILDGKCKVICLNSEP